jgi:hypothetical protein
MAQCEGASGVLHIVGDPGGLFHLRDGLVVAVDSPGAPGAEALLLRSGRISEEDWTEAFREGVKKRSRRPELVSPGRVGSGELQVVAMLAAQDGAFAVAAGSVEEFVIDEGKWIDVLLPVVRGIDPEELLRQTARRLDAVASLPFPVSPYRERVAPAPDVDVSRSSLSKGQREILAHATGRRSARDISFMVGRSVYPVTVEISRMLNEGLLEIATHRHLARPKTVIPVRPHPTDPNPVDPSPNPSPANPSSANPSRTDQSPNPSSGGPSPENGLPQQEPGGSTDRPRPSGWQALSRLFGRVRSEQGPEPPPDVGMSNTERKHVEP